MYDFIVVQPTCVHVLPDQKLEYRYSGDGAKFFKNHMCLINQAELATTYTGCVMLLVMHFNLLLFSVKLLFAYALMLCVTESMISILA